MESVRNEVWLIRCYLACLTDDLKEDLDSYLQQHLQKKVKLVRNEKREGLIRGRMIGASHATGLTLKGHFTQKWGGQKPDETDFQSDKTFVYFQNKEIYFNETWEISDFC